MHGSKPQEKKKRRQNLLVLLLLFLTVCAICVSCWALWFRNSSTLLPPDYAPVEDENAFDIIGDNGDTKLEAEEGGGAVGLTFSPVVSVDLSDKTATVMFQNPGRSVCDVVLQIIIQDRVIAQSGKIVPGKQIATVKLVENAAELLEEGGYNGYFFISMYDPETGEKAIVNSRAPVNITVKK